MDVWTRVACEVTMSGAPTRRTAADGRRKMDDSTIEEAKRPEATPVPDDEDDVESHNLLPDPQLGREMARVREAEIERRLKAHEVQAESKHQHDQQAKK